jgi:hypothetical protein
MVSLSATDGPGREAKRARQQALIDGIAAGKTVIEAAAEAGIGWRRAYVWRAEDAAFRAAWDRARAQIKARVPPPAGSPALVVPPLPAEPVPPPLHVPPSPPLPPLPSPPAPVRVTVRSFDWENEDEDDEPPAAG